MYISVCIFATIDIIYKSDKWPIDFDNSFSFELVEKGSNYLIKRFQIKKNMKMQKKKFKNYNPKLHENVVSLELVTSKMRLH